MEGRSSVFMTGSHGEDDHSFETLDPFRPNNTGEATGLAVTDKGPKRSTNCRLIAPKARRRTRLYGLQSRETQRALGAVVLRVPRGARTLGLYTKYEYWSFEYAHTLGYASAFSTRH